jgi:hypothetical protein
VGEGCAAGWTTASLLVGGRDLRTKVVLLGEEELDDSSYVAVLLVGRQVPRCGIFAITNN